MPDKKIAIFLDVLTLTHQLRLVMPHHKIDFGELLKRLLGEHLQHTAKAYVLPVQVGGRADLTQLITLLNDAGFQIQILPRGDDHRPWVESTIIPDVMNCAALVDEVVLGVHGGQYIATIQALQASGLRVTVCGVAVAMSPALRGAADTVFDIESDKSLATGIIRLKKEQE